MSDANKKRKHKKEALFWVNMYDGCLLSNRYRTVVNLLAMLYHMTSHIYPVFYALRSYYSFKKIADRIHVSLSDLSRT
jgi:hypothetical protein